MPKTQLITKKFAWKISGNLVAHSAIALVILTSTINGRVQAQGQFSQPLQQQYSGGFAPLNQTSPPSNNIIDNNYSANPVANSYSNPFAGTEITKFKPDFWTNAPAPMPTGLSGGHIIDANTVLTGILQEDISSKKSKAGDVFSIMLADDYVVNDQVLIPRDSRFVGTVLAAAPAKKNANGVPGNLQVSIQTLVNTSGVHIPVNAFIEYDPSQHTKIDTKKSRGVPVGEWAKSAEYGAYYTIGSLGSRFGIPILHKGLTGKGCEFSLSKGELLPVKLSQAIDATPLLTPTGQPNMQPNGQINGPGNGQPGWQSNVPRFTPNQFAPAINQSNNLPMQPNNDSSGQNNMLPGVISPAGPEPF